MLLVEDHFGELFAVSGRGVTLFSVWLSARSEWLVQSRN